MCRAEISAFLAYFCLNLVAMATPFALLKTLIAYITCIRRPRKPYHTRKKCLDMVYRAEISAILAYFWQNLVAMATALVAVKIQIAYLNSPTPKGCYSGEKFLDMLYGTEISAILAYFCPNLVAMATALAPLKIQIAYLNSPTPKTLPSVSYTHLTLPTIYSV